MLQAGLLRRGQRPFVLLRYWRVYDGNDAFDPIFNAYQQIHRNISFDYRTFRYSEFEHEVLNALAEDRGPDIISLPNSALHRWQSKGMLQPVPPVMTIPYREAQGTIKKEYVTVMRTEPGITTLFSERLAGEGHL